MKAIIPLAGRGTRMRPLTHHTPKPLLKVGGKPILAHLLDDVIEVGVDEVVFVVGYLGDVLRDFIEVEYPDLKAHFVEQKVQDGTAGAVALAEPYIDGELLILFSDTLFDADLSLVQRLPETDAGVLWAKEVEDYQRFGVIVTNDSGAMEKIVEKPSEPISKLANIGVYYIRDHALLFEGVRHAMATDPGKGGEFYLTDAFQYMVDQGARLITAPVAGWYDCGKPETLLETNEHLLSTTRGGVDPEATMEGVEIVEPVRVEAGATVRGSQIGPNVTIEHGATVVGSTLEHTIVGNDAILDDVEAEHSMIGARARIRGTEGRLFVAADSLVDHTD